jgi:branched-chain amino acid transport system substrate-binding protein
MFRWSQLVLAAGLVWAGALQDCAWAGDQDRPPLKIGWIGAMSGPVQKYGAYQAARLAERDINQKGGVAGRPLKLIYEDGQCNSAKAVSAFNKLVQADRVKFIIGGHCTPESVAIASLAKRNGVLILGAITATQKLSIPDDNYYRLSPVSTTAARLLAPFARKDLKLGKVGVLSAETDYAEPPARLFAELFQKEGGAVVGPETFGPDETDFRSILMRFKKAGADGLYLASQSPETPALVLRQMKELGLKMQMLGNEVVVAGFTSAGAQQSLFNGFIFAQPEFDPAKDPALTLVQEFRAEYGSDLPYGVWTAEAYDAVKVLALTIEKCGEDVAKVSACLEALKDYQGMSGKLSIDASGDGVRHYVIRKIEAGSIRTIQDGI